MSPCRPDTSSRKSKGRSTTPGSPSTPPLTPPPTPPSKPSTTTPSRHSTRRTCTSNKAPSSPRTCPSRPILRRPSRSTRRHPSPRPDADEIVPFGHGGPRRLGPQRSQQHLDREASEIRIARPLHAMNSIVPDRAAIGPSAWPGKAEARPLPGDGPRLVVCRPTGMGRAGGVGPPAIPILVRHGVTAGPRGGRGNRCRGDTRRRRSGWRGRPRRRGPGRRPGCRPAR